MALKYNSSTQMVYQNEKVEVQKRRMGAFKNYPGCFKKTGRN